MGLAPAIAIFPSEAERVEGMAIDEPGAKDSSPSAMTVVAVMIPRFRS